MTRRVAFWATKYVPKRTRVNFRNNRGERVSFTATKRVPQRVKVKFWTSRRKF